MNIAFYDPQMCCTTGICGPAADPELIRVATLIERLKHEGHHVARYMLSHDPGAFVSDAAVYQTLLAQGPQVLPIVTVEGAVRTMGRYPSYEDIFGPQEA